MVSELRKRQIIISAVIISLVVILTGTMIVVGVVNDWFGDEKVTLSEIYYGEFSGFDEINAKEYEELVGKKDSFVVFVDQDGCHTADRLREFVKKWASDNGVKVFRMMFSEMRETTMHEQVKYYPSFVVVSEGKVKAFLRADKDEDADEYNDYEAFKSWVKKHI